VNEIHNILKFNNKIILINNKDASSIVFFMVFIACGKAVNVDTMREKLMLAWYQSA